MSTYLRIFWLSMRQQLTYRTAILAGFITNLFFGVLRIFVLVALFQGHSEVNGLTVGGAITFTAVSQGLIAFLSLFGYFEIMQTVANGDVASDLIKPVQFFTYWLARDLGKSVVNLILRGVVFLAVYALLFPIQVPQTWQQWLALPFVLLLAWLISFSWRFLVNLSAFWTHDEQGVGRLAFMLSQFLCGFFMPLRIMPDWFSRAVAFTPFPYMLNTIIDLYLGNLQGWSIVTAILLQVFWCVVLIAIGWWVLRASIRKLVIQGG